MKKYIIQVSNRDIWFKIAEQLNDNGIAKPVVWFGLHKKKGIIAEKFPECEEYNLQNYNDLCKGKFEDVSFKPQSIPMDDGFYELKDIIKKNFNRHDLFGMWRHLDMDAIFYKMYLYVNDIVQRSGADVLICYESPHTPLDYLVYDACRKNGIKVIIFQINNIIPVMMVKEEVESTNTPIYYSSYSKEIRSDLETKLFSYLETLINDISVEPDYMVKQRKNDVPSFKKSFQTFNNTLKKSLVIFQNKHKSNRSIGISYLNLDDRWYYPFVSNYLNGKMRKHLLKEFHANVDVKYPSSNYVLFPLHYEPERTTVPDGGRYYEQLNAIIDLRANLPEEVPILVKEHYSSFTSLLIGEKGRSKYFYKAVKSMKNVYLVSYELNAKYLIKNAKAVATIAGSVLYESVLMGRPAIIFGHTWFDTCPGILRFDKQDSMIQRIEEAQLNQDEILAYFKKMLYEYSFLGVGHQSQFPKLKAMCKGKYSESDEINGYVHAIKLMLNKQSVSA